jgi:signal transduction histidine kinase
MSVRKILVVSGDYDLVHHVRQALTDLGFALQGAYSHRDALYALRTPDLDAVIVHGHMVDRQSGEATAVSLHAATKGLPIIVFRPDPTQASKNGHQSHHFTFDVLEDAAIRHVVLQALHHHTMPLKTTVSLRGRDDAEYWDVDEVQTFLALTRSLTEVLDQDEVLNRVVVAARQLTDAEECMILLPDGESDQLYLRAIVGMESDTARSFRVKTDDTVAGQVFRTGQSILIGQKGPLKVKTQYFVNSLLYVPILLKGQALGVLGVNNRNKHDVFNSHHETLLLNLAAYAAIAIENARIHEQSMRRARELRALVESIQAINASLSLDHTLAAICQQIVRALGVSLSEIYEYDRNAVCLRRIARYAETIWRQGYEPRLPLDDFSTLAAALRDHQLQSVRPGKTGSRIEQAYVANRGGQAMLSLPIGSDNLPLGILNLFYVKRPRQIPTGDVMQSAQKMAMESLLELLEKGRSITPTITQSLDEINRITGADWCECGLVTPERKAITLHLAYGQATWVDRTQAEINLRDLPDLVEALETQNIINQHIDGDLLTPGTHRLLEVTAGRSLLGLPLVYRGQTQGVVLCVDTETSHDFASREAEMARAVVAQASTGLENARLLHDLEASLTELKATQARLIQAERLSAMGELAAAVAHQVNNPLTTIVLDTELLLSSSPDSENHQILLAISRAGKRAAAVVRRLLLAVRPQDDQTPPAPVQVITSIEDTVALVKSHIERDGIRVVMQMPVTATPEVMAVPGELEDVWLNLLLNAHDALKGRSSPMIHVSAHYESEEQVIRVIVSDNGPGIPDAIQTKIFDPFFTTKPVGEGTGLGLHICKQVVQRVGGMIGVQSAAEQGARFVVTLPVQKGT